MTSRHEPALNRQLIRDLPDRTSPQLNNSESAKYGMARRWQLTALALSLLSQTTLSWAVSLFQSGRVPPTAISTASVSLTPLGHSIDSNIRYVVLATAALIILINLTAFGKRRPGSLIVMLVAVGLLWTTMSVATGRPDAAVNHVLLLVVVAVAAWSIGLQPADLVVLARIGIAIAFICLVMGFTTDLAWTDQDEDSKALVGDAVLAGFFPQMNPFGMSMALTLPFTFTLKRRGSRLIGFVAISAALVLASSRTALIGAAVGLLVAGTVHLSRKRGKLLVGWIAFLITTALSVVIPLLSNDDSFTRRGAVWRAVIELFPSNPLWGYGPGAFGLSGPVSRITSGAYWHGHNTVLTFALVGGLIGLVCLGLFMFLPFRNALRLSDVSLAPIAAVITLIAIGIAEAPIRPDEFDGVGWVAWLLVFVIASLDRGPHTPFPTESAPPTRVPERQNI